MKRALLLLLVLALVGCASVAPRTTPQNPLALDASVEHIEVYAEILPK